MQSELIYDFLGYSLNGWGLQQVPHLSSIPTVDLYSFQVMMKWYLAMTIMEYSYKVRLPYSTKNVQILSTLHSGCDKCSSKES